MKSYLLFQILIFALVVPNLGCSGDSVKSEESTSLSPTDPSPVADVDPASPLYVQISTKWENSDDTSESVSQTCSIDPSLPAPQLDTCEIEVPEGQLFYSDLKFVFGTYQKYQCPVVHFVPYYYKRSESDDYVPPGKTEKVSCATEPTSDCYGGAAPEIMGDTDFMKGFRSLYIVTALGNQSEKVLKAESALRRYGGYRVNYLVTNDLLDRSTTMDPLATPATGPWHKAYIGDSMVDWGVYCEDMWGHIQFGFTITIKDVDKEGAEDDAEDDYDDWD